MRRRSVNACLLVLAAAACGLVACSRSTMPTGDLLPSPPDASTTRGAVDRFVWAFVHRIDAVNRDLYTSGYAFQLAPGDTGLTRASELTRDEDLEFMQRFASGTPLRVTFDFEVVSEAADDRPGKDPRWHRRLDLRADIAILGGFSNYRIFTPLVFRAVRGDSAEIPEEIRAAGAAPDTSRWFIDRIEELAIPTTVAEGAVQALPSRRYTLGLYKVTRLRYGL